MQLHQALLDPRGCQEINPIRIWGGSLTPLRTEVVEAAWVPLTPGTVVTGSASERWLRLWGLGAVLGQVFRGQAA